MKHSNPIMSVPAVRTLGVTIFAGLLISGCASGISAPSGGINLPGGGGVSIPGGGSSGGGSSGGGSSGGGMGMPGGGSSGGGSSGGGMGMPGGGSSGGGSSGGGMGTPGGGSSGGGSAGGTMGGQSSIPMPGSSGGSAGGGAAEGCNDGGISGGGIGGGMGCEGQVGQFPGDADRAEELGDELDKSVGDFDEALGEEQRQVSSVGRNTEGFGDGSGGSGGTISLGEQASGASGSGGASGGGGGGGAAGSSETEAGPLDGISDEELQSRTPDDIDATAYDDIVARQLREAALAEDDPALRERLWEEYRKYKGMK